MALDPTTVRVSDTLLLSDCVGCDSVYRYGYRNPVEWDRKSQYFAEAKKLGSHLDILHEEYGPYSVSYGYVCPNLSKAIVKYQDPNKPSYHRWDDGAAVDVCFHNRIKENTPPIQVAFDLDPYMEYSRLLTYSESEWMCYGTKCCEEHQGRRALYENRFVGGKKPKFIKYSENRNTRVRQIAEHRLEHDWRGGGHPSYHGGGRQQLHHIRLASHVVLSDLLYVPQLVHRGRKNTPPTSDTEALNAFLEKAVRVAEAISMATEHFGSRISVVKGYDREKCWSKHGASVEVVPVAYQDGQELADFFCGNALRAEYRKTRSGIERVKFYV